MAPRFVDQSQSAFAERFADDIVLEATALAKPVEGKQNVATVLAAASSIYESLEFTAESQDASTTYLQWRATAFGGMQIDGVTILERHATGKSSRPPSVSRSWTSQPCFRRETRNVNVKVNNRRALR